MILMFGVILLGLVFEYINGFQDTANAIATVVSTRVLLPRQAVLMAAVCNLIGALMGTAVATTIGRGLVETQGITLHTLLSALVAAVIWNLTAWRFAIPSSSSHALIGGLCGGAVASANGRFDVIRWSVVNPVTHHVEGLWPKVVLPMILSPILGILLGFAVMGLLLVLLRNWRPHQIGSVFGRLQLLSASMMGFSHGSNDAQKTMGIITLALLTGTRGNLFRHLPGWLQFLHTPRFEIATWVIVVCSLTMAAGTMAGGWRIIRTLGHRMVKLQPIHGFAAETTAALVIQAASHFGIPLSTTHVISASIMGVGATRAAGRRQVDSCRPHGLDLGADHPRNGIAGIPVTAVHCTLVVRSPCFKRDHRVSRELPCRPIPQARHRRTAFALYRAPDRGDENGLGMGCHGPDHHDGRRPSRHSRGFGGDVPPTGQGLRRGGGTVRGRADSRPPGTSARASTSSGSPPQAFPRSLSSWQTATAIFSTVSWPIPTE